MQEPWWSEDDSNRGNAVIRTVNALAEDQDWRRQMALRRLSVYYGRRIGSFDVARTGKRGGQELLDGSKFPFAQSVHDTAEAKIAAKQRPIPVVLTKGASYKTRLQARKLSKFLEGQFHQPQGQFSTVWALGQQVFCDAMLADAGVVRVRANTAEGRVDIERCLAHEIYFDDIDAEYGHPTQLYHRYRYDRHQLAELLPKFKRQILEAPGYSDPDVATYNARDSQLVAVSEAYRVRFGSDCPGRHVIALEGRGGEAITLVDEPYERSTFPYVFLLWKQAPLGPWGIPLADQIELAQDEANSTFDRIRENVELGAGGIIDVEKGAYKNEDELLANDSYKVMHREPGTAPASIIQPNPYNPMVLDYAERMRSFVFELPGVSEMAAQGRKEAGINSGIALRNMNDLQGERFLPKSRTYEQFFVDVGKRILDAVQDLDAQGIKPRSFLPSEGLISEIDWQAIKPGEDDLYEVQIQAGSALSDSLPARLQFVADMQASGLITPDVAKRLLTSSDPDLEGQSKRDNAQYTWLERLICEVHDADEDEDIEIDQPDPLMNLTAATLQMTEAYLEISSWPGTPENKRRALRNWILASVELMNRGAANTQQAAPPAPSPQMQLPGMAA